MDAILFEYFHIIAKNIDLLVSFGRPVLPGLYCQIDGNGKGMHIRVLLGHCIARLLRGLFFSTVCECAGVLCPFVTRNGEFLTFWAKVRSSTNLLTHTVHFDSKGVMRAPTIT